MKQIIISLFFLAFTNIVFAQKINSTSSVITFNIGNLFGSVDGKINGMSGTIDFKENNLGKSSFNVCIQPNTIDTESKKRDEHLKSDDFFDVTKYTTICFVSESIVKKGDKYETVGKLTMHGVTKTVTLPFSVEKKEGKTIFTGNLEVNRFDYNITFGNKFMVGEIAKVTIMAIVE